MHEVSIVEGLIDQVEKLKQKHHFNAVREIFITCGIYNSISEENMNFCMKTAAKGTYLEDAVVKITRLPERWRCLECNAEFTRADRGVEPCCATCGAKSAMPLLNSEMYLDRLEVD